MEAGWKCVIMEHLVLCVMRDGVTVMLQLSAHTLATVHPIIVSLFT